MKTSIYRAGLGAALLRRLVLPAGVTLLAGLPPLLSGCAVISTTASVAGTAVSTTVGVASTAVGVGVSATKGAVDLATP
ncbi:MAG: hypothetical protein PF483_06735 [Halothiobacillus sp.]|jgi:hypothetical protein|nr:hypothetical protein [Halothiobacillus sp.]